MVNIPVNAEIQAVPIQAGSAQGDAAGGESAMARIPGGPAEFDKIGPRLKAMLRAARSHGVELDPNEFRAASAIPAAADLSQWAQDAGMWSRAVRIRWSHLLRFQDAGPVVLLFNDGGAAIPHDEWATASS